MNKKAKELIITAIILIVACAMIIPAIIVRTVADENTIVEGFYGFDLSSAGDVTVRAIASEGQITESTLDSGMTLYEGSNQLSVTVPSAKAGNQYVVILSSGSELPDDADDILYMDQKAGEGNSLEFIVYPVKPDKTTELSLFITSDDADFDTKVIRLGYSFGHDPAQVTTGWQLIDDKWYYFDESGVMQTGIQTINGAKYYLDPVNGDMKIGWVKDSGIWYYATNSGALAKGWLKSGNSWYYLDPETCAMKTGWLKVGSNWYYMNASGAMQTGWQKIGNTWYYLKSSGAMAANEWCGGYWLNKNGSWTYKSKGSWKKDSKGWWFGDTSGWYAKNTTIKIDNKNYTFNASGYWVK